MTRWLRRLAARWMDAAWLYDMRRHEVVSRRTAHRLQQAKTGDFLDDLLTGGE